MTKLRFAAQSLVLVSFSAALAVLPACTKKEEAVAPQATTEHAAPPAEAAPAAAIAPAPTIDPNKKPDVELSIGTEGDAMAFDKKELSAKAGSVVRVTFTNNAKSNSGMQHNWVLTRPGTETDVANQGIQAGEAGNWVKEGPNVLAYTNLLKKGDGEKASVTFVAPPVGDYPYICSFPGHAMVMKGVFKSTP